MSRVTSRGGTGSDVYVSRSYTSSVIKSILYFRAIYCEERESPQTSTVRSLILLSRDMIDPVGLLNVGTP